MAFIKPIVFPVLVLCCIIYVDSTKLAKALNDLGEELPQRQIKEHVKSEEEQESLAIKELRTEVARLRIKNKELESRLDQLDSFSRKQLSDFESNLYHVASTVDKLATSNHSHPRVHLPISFSSYLIPEEYPYVPLDRTIVFNHVFVNDENCYDKTTGIFTAPITGIYVFSYYVYVDFYHWIKIQLTLDGIVVSGACVDAYELQNVGSGGNLAVLRVYKGQRVQVKGSEDIGYILIDNLLARSTFSGFLLYVV